MAIDSLKNIRFHYLVKPFFFLNRKKVRVFLGELFSKEGKHPAAIDYIFCADKYLLDINRKFLRHDYYTDIITFDLSENHSRVIGEIYISVDRVKENARSMNYPFRTELLRVIFHGALHLCGHSDKTKSQRAAMRALEDKYLNSFLTKRDKFHVKQ